MSNGLNGSGMAVSVQESSLVICGVAQVSPHLLDGKEKIMTSIR
jgi:hypothetical protein